MKNWFGIAAIVAALMLVVSGCSKDQEKKKVAAVQLASGNIGTAGGQVEIASGDFVGTSVNVPANALAANTTLTIGTAASQGTASNMTRVGQTFEFGPTGTTFNVPATVQLRYDSTLLPAGTTAADVVIMHQSGTGTPTVLAGSGTNGNTQYVSGDTSSFSRFWAAVNTPAPLVPTISLIAPSSGSTTGGTTVVITGSNFGTTANTTVTFGGTAATIVSIQGTGSAMGIAVTTPAHAAGVVNVVVSVAGQSATSVGGFTYTSGANVTVTSISPTSGPEAGGTAVTITGAGFQTGQGQQGLLVNVAFMTALATNVTVVSDTEITCTSPAGTGVVTVGVTITQGATILGVAGLPNAYTYTTGGGGGSIDVVSVSPTSGPVGGTVTVTGTGFSNPGTLLVTMLVSGNTLSASSATVVSDTSLTFVVPAGATEGLLWAIQVRITMGTTIIDTLLDAFTVTAPAGTGSWVASTTTGAPSARSNFSIAQNSGNIYVWGGANDTGTFYNDGAYYNHTANTWTAMATQGAPSARSLAQMVQAGTKLYVWGGVNASGNATGGAIYDTVAQSWSAMNTTGAVDGPAHSNQTHIYAYGTNGGARYIVATDTWEALPTTGAPAGRFNAFSAIVNGYYIVWGGFVPTVTPVSVVNTGAKLNLSTMTWSDITTTNAPNARQEGGAGVSNNTFVVWGGASPNGSERNDGGFYDPATDTWTATSDVGAPSPRSHMVSITSGAGVVFWGGANYDGNNTVRLNSGAIFNASTNAWTTMTTTDAPTNRSHSGGVYVGKIFIWGGSESLTTGFNTTSVNTGGVFTP